MTVVLDEKDVDRISKRVAEHLRIEFQPVFDHLVPESNGPGVEVLSRPEAAQLRGVSERQLIRLEGRGECPRARRLSPGRVAYLRHELEGQAAATVLAGARRVLNRSDLAEKLGLNSRTLNRILGHLPSANAEGEWYEREIDEWLLRTPLA